MGAPGLRIGFLHAPQRLLSRLSAAMAAASWTAAPIMAEVAARWLSDGTLDEILKRKREEAAGRQDVAASVFGAAGVEIDRLGGLVPVKPPHRANGRLQVVSSSGRLLSNTPAEDGRGARLSMPPAGFHVWLRLPEPWRARDFAAEAEALGVRVTPADAFVSGRAEAPHAVRLCLGNATSRPELKKGVGVLAQLLTAPLGATRQVV